MDSHHSLTPVVHRHVPDAEWLAKKIIEEYMVIASFTREAEAVARGSMTAEYRITTLSGSKRAFQRVEELRNHIHLLDMVVYDMQKQLQCHVHRALSSGQTNPYALPDPGRFGFANNPLPPKFRQASLAHMLNDTDVGVNIFQNQFFANPVSLYRPRNPLVRFDQYRFNRYPAMYGAIGQPVPRRTSTASTTLTSPINPNSPGRYTIEDSPTCNRKGRPHALSCSTTVTADTDTTDAEAESYCATPTPNRSVQQLIQDVKKCCLKSDPTATGQILAMLEKLNDEVAGTRESLDETKKDHAELHHAYKELSKSKSY